MVYCIILLVLGAICLTLFLMEKIKAYSVKETLIKSCTSFLFILLAVYANFHNGNHPFGMFVICALTLGLMGDIWLDLKYVFKEQDRIFTYAGFISFALGHVFYITGMLFFLPVAKYWHTFVIPFVMGLVSGGLILLMEKPLKMQYGEFKPICFIYGSLLFTTMFTALYFVIVSIVNGTQMPTLYMLLAGGLLFAISDVILCGTYFAENRERPIDIITNSVTYYAAQYIIAFSLFFLI